MTETEKLELQLYERYVSILRNKKQEIKIRLRNTQNRKMESKYGDDFDPKEYWTDEKLETLKKATIKKFNELCRTENIKEQLLEQAVNEFCNEINKKSQYTTISVEKEKIDTGNIKGFAKTEVEVYEYKYGYRFKIQSKPIKEKVFTTLNNDVKLANELAKEVEKLEKQVDEKKEKYKKGNNPFKESIKKSFKDAKNLRKSRHKSKVEKRKVIYDKMGKNYSKTNISKALRNVRKELQYIPENVELGQDELINDSLGLVKEANALAKIKKITSPIVPHASIEDIKKIMSMSDDIIEMFSEAYFDEQNILAADKEFQEECGDFIDWYDDNLDWDEMDDGSFILKTDIESAAKESEKEFEKYNKQVWRDIRYIQENYAENDPTSPTGMSKPLAGIAIDVTVLGSGNYGKEAANSFRNKEGRPDMGDESPMYGNNKVTPYINPNLPIMEITDDANLLYLFPELRDPNNKNKEISNSRFAEAYSIRNKEISRTFGDDTRVENEALKVLDTAKELFGDEWKKALKRNTTRRSNLREGWSETVEGYKNKDPELLKQRMENFWNGSESQIIRKAQKEAVILSQKVTNRMKGHKVSFKKDIKLRVNLDDVKTNLVKYSYDAIEQLKKEQKPSQARNTLVIKSGQQMLLENIFNTDYIKYERKQGTLNKKETPTTKITTVTKQVATTTKTPIKRIIMRRSGLKPFLLPKEAIESYYVKNQYGDVLAACFFQILVSNTPIDEPYKYKERREVYEFDDVSPYKDVLIENESKTASAYYQTTRTGKEIFEEREKTRKKVVKYIDRVHIPDKDVVRNDWVFRYKGKDFKPTDSEFEGCFDKKADYTSIRKIATIFKQHSMNSGIKGISFTYQNTNPRWEQLEYGGYVQNYNSGPWKGTGKYGFEHGVKDHFTYQAPNGWLRLIEAQWNVLMEKGFDINCVLQFVQSEGFNATDVSKELIKELKINPREYDVENYIIVENIRA